MAHMLKFLCFACIPVLLAAQPRLDTLVDSGWKFVRGDVPGAAAVSYDDSRWERISIPHTWNAYDGQDGGGDYYRGPGWYRKELTVGKRMQGKSLFLKFDGVGTAARVYVNGTEVGTHKGNFGAFCFDITAHVRFRGPNTIAVRVTNAKDTTVAPLRGDFTIFGGIYRSVHLLALDSLSVSPLDHASPGVSVFQKSVTGERASVVVITRLRNGGLGSAAAKVRTAVRDRRGNVVAKAESDLVLAAHSEDSVEQPLTVPSPHLWHGRKDPYLYSVVVELLRGTRVVDRVSQPLGLRFFRVDPDSGFFLNGEPYRLLGVNRHQDREDMGWAITAREHRQDFDIIAEMGANAIRLAHYQHAQEFYDLCDRGGMVVWAELALVDEIHPSPQFLANAKQQLTELIKQNINHASIIFWSLENELIPDSNPDLYGSVVEQLNTLAKELDPTRLTAVASRSKYDGTARMNAVTDVVAYNVYRGWYEGKPENFARYADTLHQRFPKRAFAISEYGAGASIHQHEDPPRKPETRGPWHPEEWQSLLHEVTWNAMAERPFIWGTFVWNMFDFASDNRSEGDAIGRNDKGLVTFDRKVRKDAFYFYKAHWNPEPMVYITSRRYNVRPAAPADVKVYSNCDAVSLFVNETLVGEKKGPNRVFVWKDVILTEGVNGIRAVGVKDGVRFEDRCEWRAGSGVVSKAVQK